MGSMGTLGTLGSVRGMRQTVSAPVRAVYMHMHMHVHMHMHMHVHMHISDRRSPRRCVAVAASTQPPRTSAHT